MTRLLIKMTFEGIQPKKLYTMKILLMCIMWLKSCYGGIPKLVIICERNCPPASEISHKAYKTQFLVKCLANCEGIDESKYKWSLQTVPEPDLLDVDYERMTVDGRFGPRFRLVEGATYWYYEEGDFIDLNCSITVEIDDPAFKRVDVEPKIVTYSAQPGYDQEPDGCEFDPKVGKTTITDFRLLCEIDHNKMNSTYELWCDKSLLLECKINEFPERKFRIPPRCSNFKMIVINQKGVKRKLWIPLARDLKLEDPFEGNDDPMDVVVDVYKGIETMLDSLDPLAKTNALKDFNNLVKEVTNMNKTDIKSKGIIEDLKFLSAEKLLQVSIIV